MMVKNEARTHSGRRGKIKHTTTKPKTAPVTTSYIHPGAIARAKALLASHEARGAQVHIVYDSANGCMWIRNG